MRKTNSCYERHKFCTLLDMYFDLKCNKAWVKEEAGFLIYSYSSQQDRCQIFLFFFFNQIFWFSEIPERTTYACTAGMRLILVRDHFSPVHCYFILSAHKIIYQNDVTMHRQEMVLAKNWSHTSIVQWWLKRVLWFQWFDTYSLHHHTSITKKKYRIVC